MEFETKDTITRAVGETRLFRGRAEMSFRVNVEVFQQPVSLHSGQKTLVIIQNGQQVVLSPASMRDLIRWSEGYEHISGLYSSISTVPAMEKVTAPPMEKPPMVERPTLKIKK